MELFDTTELTFLTELKVWNELGIEVIELTSMNEPNGKIELACLNELFHQTLELRV
jgi:hypothetical protein